MLGALPRIMAALWLAGETCLLKGKTEDCVVAACIKMSMVTMLSEPGDTDAVNDAVLPLKIGRVCGDNPCLLCSVDGVSIKSQGWLYRKLS